MVLFKNIINKFAKTFFSRKDILKFIFLLFFVISFTYGTTFQQFRLFDLDNIPSGLTDTVNYVKMSKGNYDIAAHHRYRFIIPSTVSLIKPSIENIISEPNEQFKSAFYIVNFIIISITALFLFYLIENTGLPTYSALLGVSIFLSSRQTTIATSFPMVDSLALLACIFVIYTSYTKKNNLLILFLPFIALTKDSSLPFLVMPLFSRNLRKIPYFISLLISVSGVIFSRKIIDNYLDQSSLEKVGTGLFNYLNIIYNHSQNIFDHFIQLFTIKGIHDFTNGFSFLIVIALLGYFLNKENKLSIISNEMNALVPIGFLVSMYSGNLGRLFYNYAFPTIILYVLIFIDWFINKLSSNYK